MLCMRQRVIHLQTARVICDGFVSEMCAKMLSYIQIACCARTSTNAFFRRAADILGILHNNQAAVSLSNLKLDRGDTEASLAAAFYPRPSEKAKVMNE